MLVLSHEKSLAPTMVHPFFLMPTVQMNQPLVRVVIRLFAHDSPPTVSTAAALPSLVGATLVLFGVSPLTHATPSLLLPFSSYPFAFA